MGKLKFLVVIAVMYLIYLGFSKMMDTSLTVSEKINKKLDIEDVEKKTTVIGLMMYLGYPLELHEHLLMLSEDKCFEKKEIAETNSFATYECAEVNAIVKDGKIISIIEEIRVLE